MYFIWLITIFLASTGLELLFANIGITVPFLTLAAFYSFSVFRLPSTFPAAVISATMLDLMLGRSVMIHLLILAAVIIVAALWKKYADCAVPLLQAIPGAVCAFVWVVPMLLSESFSQENLFPHLFYHNFMILAQVIFLSAVLTPLMILLLDYIAGNLEQREFSNCQDREENR